MSILEHTNWAPKQNMYEKDLQNLGGWGAYFRIKIWAGRGQISGLGQLAAEEYLVVIARFPLGSVGD